MTAFQFRKEIDEKGKLVAAQSVDRTVVNAEQADLCIFKYIQRLLYIGEYAGAGIVLWGPRLFNPLPRSVSEIWAAIEGNAMTLLQGSGSVGKSYTAAVWILLDWWRDPFFTNTKIISTTAGHAKSNTFSTLVRLHQATIVPMPGEVTGDYIGLDPKDRKSGISIIAIPTGDDGKGRLQGFHPDPRPVPHPILGPSGRVRAFIDEAEETPFGVWEGVDNMILSIEGVDVIKIICAYNPKDQTSKTAQNAEPADGWDSFDIERGVRGKNSWISKNGWFVLRIDGKNFENVKQRKMIFPGFITYLGYRKLELKDGGNSVNYYTFARGAYPPEGAIGVLISSAHLNGCRGEFVFIGVPIKVGSVDTAVDGRDNCVYTLGRCGMATAFQSAKPGAKLLRFKEPRRVVQADQQFNLPKGNTKIVGDAIMATSIKLGVSPEYLCIDATGNGSAVYSYLKAIWSEDVQGIDFNKPSTTRKVLEEDQFTPEELYDGIVTEVWFVLQKWMEFLFFAMSPGIRRDPLESELLGRRYVLGKLQKLKVEKKDDYKKRLGAESPDYADSMTILPHAVRFREGVMGVMVDAPKQPGLRKEPKHGVVDRVEWLKDVV